jgi:hypothetical protein
VDPDLTYPEPDRSDTEHDEVAELLGDILQLRPFVDCHPDFQGSRWAQDPDDERSVAFGSWDDLPYAFPGLSDRAAARHRRGRHE